MLMANLLKKYITRYLPISNWRALMAKKKKIVKPKLTGPKVLIFDIETAPIIAHVWGLWENNVGLNQIVSDWHVLSWSAKWLDDPSTKVMYDDQRGAKNIEDDKRLLQSLRNLV